jgi:hypothetical protein
MTTKKSNHAKTLVYLAAAFLCLMLGVRILGSLGELIGTALLGGLFVAGMFWCLSKAVGNRMPDELHGGEAARHIDLAAMRDTDPTLITAPLDERVVLCSPSTQPIEGK